MGLSHSPKIVTNGLVLFLDAGNTKSYPGTGTSWLDISGNDRVATVNGSPVFADGCFDITGDTTYVSMTSAVLNPRANDFTYSCWVKFDAVDSLDTIFEHGLYTDGILFRYQSNLFSLYVETPLIGTFAWTATLNVWVNIVLRRQSNSVTCYINGGQIGNALTLTTDIVISNANLFLMRSQHTTSQFTNGKIAQFSIYNRALSLDEIEQNFNALRGRFGV